MAPNTTQWTGPTFGECFSLLDNSRRKVGYLGQDSDGWCRIVDESEAIGFDLRQPEETNGRGEKGVKIPNAAPNVGTYLGVSDSTRAHRSVGLYELWELEPYGPPPQGLWRWDGSSLYDLYAGAFLVALVAHGQPSVGTPIVAEVGAGTVKLRLSTTE